MKLQVKYSTKGLFLPLQYTHKTHVKQPINSVALVLMQISDFLFQIEFRLGSRKLGGSTVL